MEQEETADTGGAESSSTPASAPLGPPPPTPQPPPVARPQPSQAPERKRPSTTSETDTDKRACVAASVLHAPEWPVLVTKDLSDDHFDYWEGGIDPALLAETREEALQQLGDFGVYEIVPKEQTGG